MDETWFAGETPVAVVRRPDRLHHCRCHFQSYRMKKIDSASQMSVAGFVVSVL
jgi:hypothetical protein